jgi:two-component system, cell cycle sensor histidine kinase and response regulator CckA
MATILLVDDDPLVMTFCSYLLLRIDGMEVLPADCCSQAIGVAGQHAGPIHVLLSDITLPGPVTGLQLAETLTKLRPDMKVVLMSGLTWDSAAFQPGWQFILKPFLPGSLIAKLEETLGWPLWPKVPGRDTGSSGQTVTHA